MPRADQKMTVSDIKDRIEKIRMNSSDEKISRR